MARVVRGGAWNNDADNARSAARNNNNPDNRNDNVGFRVLCSSHIVIFSARRFLSTVGAPPEMPADHGLPAEAGVRSMAQVSPVRTWLHCVGRILKPGAAWIRSRGAHPFSCPTA